MPIEEVVTYRIEGHDEVFDTLEEAERMEKYLMKKNYIVDFLLSELTPSTYSTPLVNYYSQDALVHVLMNHDVDEYLRFRVQSDWNMDTLLEELTFRNKEIAHLKETVHGYKTSFDDFAIVIRNDKSDKGLMLLQETYGVLMAHDFVPLAEDIYNRFLRGTVVA